MPDFYENSVKSCTRLKRKRVTKAWGANYFFSRPLFECQKPMAVCRRSFMDIFGHFPMSDTAFNDACDIYSSLMHLSDNDLMLSNISPLTN